MIQSMTGYGYAEKEFPEIKITAQIKSLNHRYLDIFTKIPRELNTLDIDIRNYIKKFLDRGRIEVFINLEKDYSTAKCIDINYSLAKQYHKCLQNLKETLNIETNITLNDILQYPDIFLAGDSLSNQEFWPMLKSVLDIAIIRLKEMREKEGIQIKHDIEERIDNIEGHLSVINERIPNALTDYKSYLQERLKEAFSIDITDERLAQEMILHAERTDVAEESVRIDIHLKRLRDLIKQDSPIGRKIDFLVQEILREVNTLAAKSLDSIITERVVEIKHELEKIREQIQNIE